MTNSKIHLFIAGNYSCIFVALCLSYLWYACRSVANGWGLHKGVALLTTANRFNYRLKPCTTEGPTYVRSAQNKVDLIFRTGKFESRLVTCDILGA